jgi:hypothetical protein
MEKKEENYYHLIHNTTSQSNSINTINDTHPNNYNLKENPLRNFNAQNQITPQPYNSLNGNYKINLNK